MAGVHALDVVEGRATLVHVAGDRRSPVHEALARRLRIGTARLDSHRSAPFAEGTTLWLDDPAGPVRLPDYRLSPFELRYAADNGVLHPIPLAARTANVRAPVTDLHSHVAACVRAEDLVALGAAHGIVYPRALLADAGIHSEHDLALAELPDALAARLARRLSIPLERRITFLEMERIYRLRSPLTKAASLWVPILEQLARDYAAMGVRYVELSVGNIVEAEVLRAVHRELPRIEASSGVTVRFLVAISRHDDPEWDEDLVARIGTLAGSGYIVGVDVMGHETNSTRAFAPVLRAVGRIARPGFVVRVHAGESPAYPENVRLALDATRAFPDVQLRIGHGLYGVDDTTLAALAAAGAVVEFNLDSNVALNHLQTARDLDLRRYVEAGVEVVLGSDGYGIYRTSPAGIARAALLAGLVPADLAGPLAATEAQVLARIVPVAAFDVPDDVVPVHFTPAVVGRRRALVQERDDALRAALGAPLADPAVLRGRDIIAVAGAWNQSWDALAEEERSEITALLDAIVRGLDPSRATLLTGGTRLGVEGVIGRLAVAHGVPVVGAVVGATPPALLGPMTHAILVGDTLYDKASGLYALVAAHDGCVLFVGGGQIVSDEIQTAKNLRLDHLLYAAVGASARHAAESGQGFHTADEALAFLAQHRRGAHQGTLDPFWFVGPNPTIDVIAHRHDEILLVLRDADAPAEAGKWALPGGFVASASARGTRWTAAETARDAAVRELCEETMLLLAPEALVEVAVYEGRGRDPRDTPEAWARTTVFAVAVEGDVALSGGDDAADARWFPLAALPPLAFDHARIVRRWLTGDSGTRRSRPSR